MSVCKREKEDVVCVCVFVGLRKKSREKDVFKIKNDINRLHPAHSSLLYSIRYSLFFIPSFLTFLSLHFCIFLPRTKISFIIT